MRIRQTAGSGREDCECIDPATFNIANNNYTGTTAAVTIPASNHAFGFDINVPPNTVNPVQQFAFGLYLYDNPDNPNPFPIKGSTDASGSALIKIIWNDKSELITEISGGQLPKGTPVVIAKIDNRKYNTLTLFIQGWPKGWTVKNISSAYPRGTPHPTTNQRIDCSQQDTTASCKHLATAAAWSVCSSCQPAPDNTMLYIIGGFILFIVGTALLKRAI